MMAQSPLIYHEYYFYGLEHESLWHATPFVDYRKTDALRNFAGRMMMVGRTGTWEKALA
jgi:hypothetical protein